MKALLCLLLAFGSTLGLASAALGQAPDTLAAHFQVYTHDGRPVSLDAVVAAMDAADAVFLGETHDDPVAHRLQARLLEAAQARYGAARPVVLSLEMFERDAQLPLDEYLQGLITEAHFLRSSRPWQNYATDYRPLVEFARAEGLPVVAANAPRRYVNRVSRLGPQGLAGLPEAALAFLPPLPYPAPSPAYTAKWNRLMYGTPTPDSAQVAAASLHGGPAFMLEGQALWDAAMAAAVAGALEAHPGALVLHMVGGFHVSGGTGTPEALRHYRPATRSLVVALHPADDVQAFVEAEHAGLGDFVILTDARLPRSYDASP